MTNNKFNKIAALFLYIISIISYYIIIDKNSNFFAIKNIIGTVFVGITTGILIYTNMKNNKFNKIAAYILYIISMIYCYMIGPKFLILLQLNMFWVVLALVLLQVFLCIQIL